MRGHKLNLKWLAGFLVLMVCISCLPLMTAAAAPDYTVERWRMREITFTSATTYADPFRDVMLDVTFTGPGDVTLVMPAFWDGGGTWKVRFAPTEAGLWQYETTCSNTADAGLHGISGTMECVPYTGDLEIYRHGFVKTVPGTRYFVYDDGTPFFYLGDTHWTMPTEPFEEMFTTIVDTRVEQGFTVYQSLPVGAPYNLANTLTEAALAGFADMDRRFSYIAEAGLLHANGELIHAPELYEGMHDGRYTEDYVRLLSRYWVARYAAYPVMWTMSMEADDDFYYNRGGAGDNTYFEAKDNPWKIVAAAVGEYDPYRHPLTAHQEFASMENGAHGMNATRSEFKKLEAHTWFAAQWSPALYQSPDFNLPRDFWYNGGGKPAINFEGRYDFFWTKHFGARAQGWISYLNGMFGYGYGAIDIWAYQMTIDMDTTSDDRRDKITPEDKATPWTESLYFETAEQMGHMRRFLEGLEWWELEPRFDSWRWFIPWWCTPWWATSYSLATQGNDVYVAYFYQDGRSTGLLRGLDCGPYQAEWFNPRTGESLTIGTVQPVLGCYAIPCKPDKNDWVFCLHR